MREHRAARQPTVDRPPNHPQARVVVRCWLTLLRSASDKRPIAYVTKDARLSSLPNASPMHPIYVSSRFTASGFMRSMTRLQITG